MYFCTRRTGASEPKILLESVFFPAVAHGTEFILFLLFLLNWGIPTAKFTLRNKQRRACIEMKKKREIAGWARGVHD